MAALALEIEHRVDHVLEHAGARDGAVLGDVADQQHGDAAALGELDQGLRRGAHLGDRARRAVDRVEPHGLDGIDHRHLGRIGPLQGRHDVAHRGRGAELHRCVADAQPFGAQPHLVERFFARDIGAGGVLARQRRRDLKQQGRLADAGIAADQQGRAHHQAAAAHAIELGDAAPVARRLRRRSGEAGELERAALAAARQSASGRSGRRGCFLDDGVPFAAGLAAAAPFARHRAARLADEALDRARHQLSSRLERHQPLPCSQQVSSFGVRVAPQPAHRPLARVVVQCLGEGCCILLAARADAGVEARPSDRARRQLGAAAVETQHEAATLLGRHRQQQASAVGQRVEPPRNRRSGAGEGHDHIPLSVDRSAGVGAAHPCRRPCFEIAPRLSAPGPGRSRPHRCGRSVR